MATDPVRRPWRTAAALAGSFAVAIIAVTPGTAAAHGEEGLADSDYRVTITHTPELAGVSVAVVESGARLELTNTGDRNVEILGYSGEPYAEIRADGAYINTNSPAAYLNESIDRDAPVPATADAAKPPAWSKAGDTPALRWHDHRAHWMGSSPPPAVTAAPDRDHRITDWIVPLRVGTTEFAVTGTLDWVAPPATTSWLAGALLLGTAVATIAVLGSGKPAATRLLAISVAAVSAMALTDAIGRSVTAADLQYNWLELLFLNQAWQAVAAVAGIAAAGYALLGRPAGELALGMAGVFLALMAGLTRFTALTKALTATPWNGDIARIMTVLVLGVGAGLAVAGLRTLWRDGRARPNPAR